MFNVYSTWNTESEVLYTCWTCAEPRFGDLSSNWAICIKFPALLLAYGTSHIGKRSTNWMTNKKRSMKMMSRPSRAPRFEDNPQARLRTQDHDPLRWITVGRRRGHCRTGKNVDGQRDCKVHQGMVQAGCNSGGSEEVEESGRKFSRVECGQ